MTEFYFTMLIKCIFFNNVIWVYSGLLFFLDTRDSQDGMECQATMDFLGPPETH